MVSPSSPAPQGPRRQVAVIGTLMPHMAAGRHHVYRNVTALALLAALIAAGLGSLPVALVLTAVALPAAVLVYIHDHRLWHDEPLTIIVVAFGLSLLLGIGVGLLETHFIKLVATGSTGYHLPPVARILELGLLVPVAAFVAVVIAPLVVSARSAFRHPMDVVVACSLSGAALSLGLSVVIQHGAFTHIQATAGDPAHVAFISLTLGFLQPIVLATAAMVGVLGLRRLGVSPVAGVIEGLVLVVAYELATTLLQPYGTRGIVLTALAAFLLAGAGLAAARDGLHEALLADTGSDADSPAAGTPSIGCMPGWSPRSLRSSLSIAAVASCGGGDERSGDTSHAAGSRRQRKDRSAPRVSDRIRPSHARPIQERPLGERGFGVEQLIAGGRFGRHRQPCGRNQHDRGARLDNHSSRSGVRQPQQ